MEEQKEEYASEIEQRRKPLKDVDAAERVFLYKALVWLTPAGFLVSLSLTALLANRGWNPLAALGAGFAIGLGGMLLVYFGVIGGTASLFGKVYFISGSTGTPLPRTSWRAQALAVHGSLDKALAALEEEAARYPDDPGPCLRAAALCLDELDDPEGACRWYERARRAVDLAPETDQYLSVRLAELYESLGAEDRARVELRRLLELHPDSAYAAGARARLATLKIRQIQAFQNEDDA
jgi:tetratricopeptide (TPR) repeat protein